MKEELHNHTGNADKFKTTLDDDASIYQQRETKSGREQMAGLQGKAKAQFFMEYYARALLVVVLIVVAVIYFIYNYVTSADYPLSILAVNAYGGVDEEFEEDFLADFLDRNGYDTSKYEVGVNRSLTMSSDSSDSMDIYSTQAIMTMFAAGEADLFFADSEYFRQLASNDYVNNLEDYLTADEIASLDEDSLVYVTIEEDEEEEEASEEENEERTILAGIIVPTEEGWLAQVQWYSEGMEVVVGIGGSVKDEELAVALLKEILFYE